MEKVTVIALWDYCSKCRINPRRSKTQRWCDECHAKHMKVNRVKHSELSDEQRKRANARSYANVYKRRGKLVQESCKNCGDPDTEMHHEDYDKPLEVIWLCKECHIEHHYNDEG